MIEPADLERAGDILTRLTSAFDAHVVGQPMLRRALLAGLLSGGHVLLESVPGLAKTLAASTLARCVDGSFSRIQCTPDLLPSDIIGTQVFDPSTTQFRTELGPVHANIVLLDEVNRSSAKTQSAMLEAMQERQTTVGGETHPLPTPFMVLATQNPIDDEGTYLLPHAQMDRFLLKEVVTYPSAKAELQMLDGLDAGTIQQAPDPVCSTEDVLWLQQLTAQVAASEAVKRFVVQLVTVTRRPDEFLDSAQARRIEHGASPRGTIALLSVARAVALLEGRDHVVPDDVVAMRHAVLRHRLVLSFEAQAEGVPADELVDAVFAAVPTP